MVPWQTRAAKAVKESAGKLKSPNLTEAEYSDRGAVSDEHVSRRNGLRRKRCHLDILN
jgi:hypothetical protein